MVLAPDFQVALEFTDSQPVVPPTDLPLLLIGLARQTVWRTKPTVGGSTTDPGTFQGGGDNDPYTFPGLVAGAVLEQHDDTSIADILKPEVFIRNFLGTEEVPTASITFDYVASPPTFDIGDSISLTYDVLTNTTGAFDAAGVVSDVDAEGLFTDPNVDFLAAGGGTESKVSVGSTIKVNDTPTFLVEAIIDGQTMEVSRIDKGSGTINGDLTVADSDGFRTFTSLDATFVTSGVIPGDLVLVEGVTLLDSSFGAAYAGGAGTQTLTDGDATFLASPAIVSIASGVDPTVAAALFDYVAILTGSDRIPTFWVDATGAPTATTLEMTPFAGAPAVDADVAYTINRLGAARDITGVSGFDIGSWTVAAGVVTFTTVLSPITNISVGDILCDTVDGGRPLYVVTEVLTTTTAEVVPLNSGVAAGPVASGFFRPQVGASAVQLVVASGTDDMQLANVLNQNITFSLITTGGAGPTVAVTGNEQDGFVMVVTDDGSADVEAVVAAINADSTTGLMAETIAALGAGIIDTDITAFAIGTTNQLRIINGGGAYTVETAGVRTLTAEGQNFTTTIGPVGAIASTPTDLRPIVYDSSDAALFFVTAVVDDETLSVINIVSGTPAAGASDADFGFRIRSRDVATLIVQSITSETALQVKNQFSAGDPAAATVFSDLFYRAVAANALSNIDYVVSRTVTGSELNGDVLSTFTARRSDIDVPLVVDGDPDSAIFFKNLLGAAIPINPLALAAEIALQNTSGQILVLGTPDETIASFTAALQTSETDLIYIPVLLTQDPEILGLVPSHVVQNSLPQCKRERISYVSFANVVQTTKVSFSADTITVAKSGTTTTVNITSRDISDLIGVGDLFEGSTAGESFAGSVLSITTPLTGTTVMTLTVDASFTGSVTPEAVTAFTIKSAPLTLAEEAAAQKALADSTDERRVRVIYPGDGVRQMTDDTAGVGITNDGFFGGGDFEQTIGGHFFCAQEGAKRSNQNPAQPLAGITSGGWVSINDRFATQPTLRDSIIDGGTFYLERLPNGTVTTVRGLTTDTSVLQKVVDTGDPQRDKAARRFRAAVRPLLGKHVLDAPFFDLLSQNLRAARKVLVETNREIKRLDIISVKEDPDNPDTFLIEADAEIYFDAAHGRMTIFV